VAVATGNWGCGAFGGDPHLKSLLQLMAAAEAGRDVAYFTFKNKKLRDDIFDMYSFLVEHDVTVQRLFLIICDYRQHMNQDYDLHTHIIASLSYDADTDEDASMQVVESPAMQLEEDSVTATEPSVNQEPLGKAENGDCAIPKLTLTLSKRVSVGAQGSSPESRPGGSAEPTADKQRPGGLEKLEKSAKARTRSVEPRNGTQTKIDSYFRKNSL
jgi:hypothetical protein